MTVVIPVTDCRAIDAIIAGQSGDLAFDIGANCGQTVERLLPSFKTVVAVEPASESYAVLQDAYLSNPAVILLPAACTDHYGHVDLDVRDVIGTGQLTSGDGPLPWGEWHETRSVPAVTLDHVTNTYGAPDFVKIDTEGHEVLVLEGAGRTLGVCPFWLVEIHTRQKGEECLTIFRDAGFDLRTIEHPRETPENKPHHYWLIATSP